MTPQTSPSIVPPEGWHVLHLFYKVEHGQWQLFTENEKIRAKTRLAELVQEIRSTPDTQLVLCAMVTPKADLGFMLATPDLQVANAWEKQLNLALGADVLSPVGAFLSMTEPPAAEPGESDDTEEMRERAKNGTGLRLYPALPDWPVVLFYPIIKRRRPGQNWYTLPPGEQRRHSDAQARIEQKWHGKIVQVVTCGAGLDDAEWIVTQFALATGDLKSMASETRHDPAAAEYMDYGEFFLGLQLPLDELYRRVQL